MQLHGKKHYFSGFKVESEQSTHLTDKQTERQTDREAWAIPCVASHAVAWEKALYSGFKVKNEQNSFTT